MAGQRWLHAITLTSLLGAVACGGGEKAAPPAASTPAAAGSDLTPWQLENGIGPITETITLGPVNHEMAEAGQKLFEAKCSACHKLGERYVGPPLGGITGQGDPRVCHEHDPQSAGDVHPAPGREEVAR